MLIIYSAIPEKIFITIYKILRYFTKKPVHTGILLSEHTHMCIYHKVVQLNGFLFLLYDNTESGEKGSNLKIYKMRDY